MAPRRLSSQVVAHVLRYALSIAALLWLAHNVTWSDFAALATVDPALLSCAVVVSGLTYPLQAWRWQLLLRAQDISPPTRAVHRAFWIGLFYNSFLPGGIAGDAVRFAWLWRVAPDRKTGSAASVVMDRLLGLATLLALAALGLGLHLTTRGGSPQLHSLWIATSAALTAAAVLWWLATRSEGWEKFAARWVGATRAAQLRSVSQAFRLPFATLALPLGLSVAIWLLDFTSLWLLARAVGLSIGFGAIASAAAAAYAAAALPISVGGHGVRETTLVAILGLFGAGGAHSAELTTLALVFWAVTVSWALVGGVVCLLSLVRRSSAPAAAETAL